MNKSNEFYFRPTKKKKRKKKERKVTSRKPRKTNTHKIWNHSSPLQSDKFTSDDTFRVGKAQSWIDEVAVGRIVSQYS